MDRSPPRTNLVSGSVVFPRVDLSQPSQLDQWPAPAGVPAAAEIYEESGPFIWRNLRRLGVPPDQIEDAVQDVFLVIHCQLPEFEARSSLRTWIFGIVIRVAARYREQLRNRKQRYLPVPPSLLEALSPATTNQGPFDQLFEQQAAELIGWALAELDEEKRTMLIMVELEQMSVVDAAKVLNINVNSAYTRLRLARRALEAKLTPLLGESGA